MDSLIPLHDALVQWLGHGLLDLAWWQVALIALVLTHITIAAVTIFLHRSQAHRALDLSAAPSHFFRLWLWLTTGMVTREWVAIHRKHHAKCETPDDPHSPVTRGLKTVLLTGSELYRAEAKVQDTLQKYGRGTPDDWMERNVYTAHSTKGVFLMLVIDLLCFGALGATVWAVQMAWIPVTAAGIINGVGHHWGYRNFEAPDASTNIVPWGVIIGGEELHNNHHTYPTSAKLSVKPFEFDIAWGYIRALELLGQAKVRKTAPQLALGELKATPDATTLEALIANRYELMAHYGRHLKEACRTELDRLQAQGQQGTAKWLNLRAARRWAHRDADRIPADVQPRIHDARIEAPVLDKLLIMREDLRLLWTRTNVSREQLVSDLQAWCRQAEESGITALREFALKLRAAQA